MKKLILTLTALSALAIGAPAATTMIASLPATISAPGDYLLDPAAVTAPVFDNQNGVIYITVSNVNLDLNGLTIEAPGDGIQVGANLNHVSITNGTVDGGTAGLLYFGLIIGAGCDHVSVSEVAFTGVFGGNYDYGAYTTLKNCTFQNYLQLYTQGTPAAGITPGHGNYQNLTVSNAPGGPALVSIDPNYAGFTAPFNNFKNITVLAGNVQLSPGDTYQHFFTTGSTQIVGGINVQPGNQNSNSK